MAPERPHVVAAVQVRMGSTRLPNKALADLLGRPMLWHIVNRVRFAKRIAQVVVATSDSAADAPIRALAEAQQIPCYAGSELDLVDRLWQTAQRFQATALVRVTGDCPLVDPAVLDDLVAASQAQAQSADYVTNTMPPTYPDGLDAEVYPMRTLERLHTELTDPFWREWFTTCLDQHQQSYRPFNLPYSEDLCALRWTVDYEEDLLFVRAVYEELHRDGQVFGLTDVLALLHRRPELARINARYARNEGLAIALAHRKESP